MKKLAAMTSSRKVKSVHKQWARQAQHERNLNMFRETPFAMSQSNGTFCETINELQIFICRSYVH